MRRWQRQRYGRSLVPDVWGGNWFEPKPEHELGIGRAGHTVPHAKDRGWSSPFVLASYGRERRATLCDLEPEIAVEATAHFGRSVFTQEMTATVGAEFACDKSCRDGGDKTR